MQVLLKKPYFYLTMIGMMLATIASNGVYSAVVPHLQDRGLSAAYAAKMLSLMLVLLAVDKIVLGMLADRFGAHFSTLLCVLFTFSGIVVLTLVKTSGRPSSRSCCCRCPSASTASSSRCWPRRSSAAAPTIRRSAS